jgi:hypothetical protein
VLSASLVFVNCHNANIGIAYAVSGEPITVLIRGFAVNKGSEAPLWTVEHLNSVPLLLQLGVVTSTLLQLIYVNDLFTKVYVKSSASAREEILLRNLPIRSIRLPKDTPALSLISILPLIIQQPG